MTAMHERMKVVAGKRSYRAIGELTNQHPETVRRYMQGGSPSIEFVSALCHQLGVNANWLLSGQGTTYVKDAKEEALRDANPSELLTHVAAMLEDLAGRLDRIEVFVQTLETRVRAASALSDEQTIGKAESDHTQSARPSDRGGRARSVADAVPERSPEDAD